MPSAHSQWSARQAAAALPAPKAVTPAGAQVSLTGGFAARIAAAVVAALAPRLDSIAASLAAVKLQQGLAATQIASLQTQEKTDMGNVASSEATLQSTLDTIQTAMASMGTGVSNLGIAVAANNALIAQLEAGQTVTPAQIVALNIEAANIATAATAINGALLAIVPANPVPPAAQPASQTAAAKK